MGRVKNAGKRITAWLLAMCMILSVMPPIEVKAATSLETATITLWEGGKQVASDTYVYTGEAFTPEVRVELNGEIVAKTNADGISNYSVSYNNNTNSGTATVIVKGLSSYAGSKTVEFKINQAPLDVWSVSFANDDVENKTGLKPYMFYTGTPLTPSVTVQGTTAAGDKISLTQADYSISYSTNNTNVSVDTPASVTVTLKPESNYSSTNSTITKQFYIFYDLGKVTLSQSSQNALNAMVYSGKEVVPASLEVYGVNGEPLTINQDYYICDDWSKKVDAGDTSLTIDAYTTNANCKYRGTKTFEATIQKYDITSARIELDQDSYEYTGTGEKKQDMTDHVSVYIGDQSEPVSSDNYIVTYSDESIGNIGTNWLTITGQKNLTGIREIDFQIVETIKSATIGNKEIPYSGNAVTVPDLGITVTDAADTEVGSDSYDVEFYSDAACTNKVSSPTEVGDYYVKITAKGNYVGTLFGETYKFSIVQQSFDNCKFSLTYYNGTNKNFILSEDTVVTETYCPDGIYLKISEAEDANGNSLTADTDYTYGIYSDAACTQELDKTGGNYVISKAGTYYIKVVSTGTGNYAAGERKFQFNVSPMKLTPGDLTIKIADKMYTGSAIIPTSDDIEISFKDGSKTVILSASDYKIGAASNNVNIQNKNDGASDAKIPTVEILLQGNYTLGTDVIAKGYFSIIPKMISNCQCNLVADSANYDASQLSRPYTGGIQKPAITITDEGRTLTEGVDYEVSYKKGASDAVPCNVGEYTVTITGKGNYASTAPNADITATFTITQKSIAGLSLSVADVDYTGGAIDASAVNITLTDGTKTLIRDTDYKVEKFYTDEVCTTELESLTDAGLVYVKLQGIGNYSGEIVGSFHIGKDLTQYIKDFDVSGWTYNVDYQGAVSYYSDIENKIKEEIQQKVSATGVDVKYTITYYKDSQRTEPIGSTNTAFSSAGTIYYRITGKDGFYGSVVGSASIAKKSLSELKAEIVGDYVYSEGTTVTYYEAGTGKGVIVYDYASGTSQHVLSTSEYEIYDGDAYINAGEHTITLKASEINYTGSLTIPFTIQPKQITSLTDLKVDIPSQTYSYQVLRPSVKLEYKTKDGSVTTLSSNAYEIALYADPEYSTSAKDENLTNAGTVYVKVTGKGNYTGTILSSQYVAAGGEVQGSNQFIIEPLNIATSGVIIDIEGKDYIYEKGKTMIFKVQQPFRRDSITTQTVELVKGQDYTYTEPDTSVDLRVGEQTITLTGEGNYTGTRSFTFNFAGDLSKEEHATITIGDENTLVTENFTGNAITLDSRTIKIISKYNNQTLTSGTEYIVNYKDNIEPGLATVILTGNNDKHWYGTVEKNFAIIGDLSDPTYTEITIPDQSYTGSAYNTTTQPIRGMVVKFHGRVLTEGVDYVVSAVKDGDKVSNNGATVTITAKEGSYFAGSATANFSIKYDSSKLNITLNKTSWDYNDGNEVKPTVKVIYPTGGSDDSTAGVVLTEGTDYTVIYHNNTEVGAANGFQGPYVEVKPTEDGRITGDSQFIPFTINKIDISKCVIGGVKDSYVYTGSMIKPNSMVVYKSDGTTVIDPSNYEVIYETSAANPTMAPAGCTETITIKGKGNYTGTLSKSFGITSRDLVTQATCTIEEQTYSAKELTPDVTITILDENGVEKTLKAGTDYMVAGYYNNVNAADKSAAGAPYASISGTGSCTGSLNALFTIKKRDMNDLVYSQVENPQYVPGQTDYRPDVSVYMSAIDEDSKLTAGREYSVNYYNNTAVLGQNGTSGPYMEFTPIDTNNYEGSYHIFFSIFAKDISSGDIKVTLADTVDSGFDSKNRNYVYDKGKTSYSPQPTVYFDDGTTSVRLTAADYSINYENNTGIGTGYVVLTGTGNYTGMRKEAFTIGTLISNDTVTITGVSDKVYNGQDTTPTDLKVKFNAKNEYLVEQTADTVGDYTVGYYLDESCQIPASLANMQNAGRIYVGVTGTADANGGGYVGTAVVSYEITRKSLTSSDIVVQGNDDVDYTGSAVYPENLQLIDTTTGRVIDPVYYTVIYENNVEIGTASATITASETGNYKDSITVYYRVTKHSINNAVAEAIPDQKYTGNYIIPELTIYDNGKRLVKGVDYDVVNGNNLRAGESWVIIKGLGNYDQTKKVYFNIVASLETAIVDDIPDQLYTGSPITPTEKVACGGNTLVRGVDYSVTYANNVAVGDASITIRPLTQYYTGTIVKKFTITNSIEKATVTGIPASYKYTGEAFVPEPVVKFNGVTLTKNVDYTVVYRNNVNVGTASVIVSGMGKYSGSKTVNFTIVQKSITSCSIYMVSSQNFTGKLITPPVVVKDGNKALTQGVDYAVSYSNNLDVGTGNATIVGRGDYQGTVTKQFKIEAQDPVRNVLIQNKNESAGTFDVLIDETAVYVDSIRVRVWAKADQSDAYNYSAERVDGDTFIARVNAANHGNTSGTYQIVVYASGQNYEEHQVYQAATTFQPATQGSWKMSSSGWWYEYEDGGYVSSDWLELDGTWYYFNGAGYMTTGWQQVGGTWYYFGNDGCMRTGWQQIGGIWYYMKDSGAMATGWNLINGQWYYMNGSGAMLTGWQQIGGTWYYMKDSGAMVTGWIKSGDTWYYMKDSGAMATGWQQIGGTWYYMYPSGAMAANTWIGRDYVSASGAWTASR
ncbi:MAG: GBS Bsp-like repeat-containing protein [Roseburia sp.]